MVQALPVRGMSTLAAASPSPPLAADPTRRLVRDDLAYRVLRAGAIYDLVVTAPFATPFTASLVLAAMRAIHDRFALGGARLPDFGAPHLLFVSFFGTIVTIWSVLRATSRARVVHTMDTVGRGLFSAWMAWALAGGASRAVVPFLALEVAFFLAQGWALRRDSGR